MENLEKDLLSFSAEKPEIILPKVNRIKVLFEKQTLSAQQRDEYIQILLNNSYGLLKFILSKLSDKQYAGVKTEAMEIIYTIINNFPFKVYKYVGDILQFCLKVTMCANLSFNEYCKAFDIMQKTILIQGAEDHIKELYTKLYKQFFYSHMSQKPKRAYYSTIGLIIRKHYSIVQQDSAILNLLKMLIEKEIKSKNIVIVDGLVSCLADCLAQIEPKEERYFEQIYAILKKLIDMDNRDKNFQRSAFSLLKDHISIFGKFLENDSRLWLDVFKKWFTATGDNLRSIFSLAISFFEYLSSSILSHPEQNRSETLLLYLNYYEKHVFDDSYEGSEKHLAIRVYGLFGKPYSLQVDDKEFHNFFMKFHVQIKLLYCCNSVEMRKLDYLSTYTLSLSEIICAKAHLFDENLDFLSSLMCMSLREFPAINYYHHYLVVRNILTSLNNVSQVNPIKYRMVLRNLIYDGVQWSCSRELAENDDDNALQYKNYLPLWVAFLQKENYRFIKENQKVLHSHICQELIATFIKLMHKLNLKTAYNDINDPAFEEHYLEAEQYYDFNIFVNFVDFFSDILKDWDRSELRQYILIVLNNLITLSIQHPLVIGFYKLLTVWLKIACESNYFSEERLLNRKDLRNVHDILSSYVQDLLFQMKEYGEDLQIACLEVVISLPVSIIKEHLPNITSQIIVMLKLGQGYLSIIEMAVGTLEKLNESIPESEIEPYFTMILPYLDSYLRSKSLLENNISINVKRKTMTTLKDRKIIIESDSQLYDLQRKILQFLGKLSSKLCIALVEGGSKVQPVLWNKSCHLKITLVSCGGENIDIFLDKFVPEIIYLSLKCSNRKTRFAACELLHALSTLILDKNFGSQDESKLLLEKIFSAVLLLCCDMDQQIKKIFSCFFWQMMHWYARPNSNKNEVNIVLNTLMDGITYELNSSVRSFSGQCLREFLQWVKKQREQNASLEENVHINFIIDKVEQFSMHSDIYKRLGAAIIFNNIYVVLRNDDDLVNKYWIKLLNVFVRSVSTMEHNCNEDKYLQQLTFSLNHLENVFKEKKHLFNISNNKRITPPGLNGNKLVDVAVWLFENSDTTSIYCRQKCLKIFTEIAPITSNFTDMQSFFVINRIYTLLSRNLESKELNFEPDTYKSASKLFQWLKLFNKVIDFHTIALQNHIRINKLNKTILKSFADFVSIFTTETRKLPLNYPQEKKMFINLRHSIILSLFNLFLQCLSNKKNIDNLSELFATRQFSIFILHCSFKIQQFSFFHNTKHFETKILMFLNYFNNHAVLKENLKIEFKQVFEAYKMDEELKREDNDTSRYIQMLKGLMLLQKTFLNDWIKIKTKYNDVIANVNENFVECANLKLNIVLKNYDNYQEVTDSLMNKSGTSIVLFKTFQRGFIEFFINKFNLIFNYVLKSYKNRLENFMFIITSIIEYFLEKTEFSEEEKKTDIINGLLSNWGEFSSNFESKTKLIDLLKTAMQLTKKKGDELNSISDWIFTLFHSEEINMEIYLTFVGKVFELFPYMTNSPNKILENEIFQLVNTKLLAVPVDENNRTFMKVVLQNLLNVLYADPGRSYFKFFVEVYVKTSHDKAHLDLVEGIKMYMLNANEINQTSELEIIYSMSKDCVNFNNNERYHLVKSILVRMLQSSSINALRQFYLNILGDVKNSFSSKANTDETIVTKTLVFILIENIFSDLDIDAPENKHIVNVEFRKQCSINCYETISNSLSASDVNKELLRIYYCHAYNALASVICNSQKNLTDRLCYSMFPFDKCLWKNILDGNNYTFDCNKRDVSKYKQIVTGIRDEIKLKKKSINLSFKTQKYIESQNLLKSTLTGSFHKYDFTNATIREKLVYERTAQGNTNDVKSEIFLEVGDINNHECMPTFCAVVKHLLDTHLKSAEVKQDSLPYFMKCIEQILTGNNSNNTKIFICKLIENMKDLFKNYAKWFMAPILKTILHGSLGTGINALTTDLILMIASWQNLDIAQDNLMSDLIDYLINNVHNDDKFILKTNINLIKIVMELWHDYIKCSPHSIMKHLGQATGIIICNIALVNKISPWGDDVNNLDKFANKLINHLSTGNLYAAECLGNLLKFISTSAVPNRLNSIEGELQVKLSKAKEEDRIKCLEKISENYSPIVKNFTYLIFMLLNPSFRLKDEILTTFANSPEALISSNDANKFLDNLDDLLKNNNSLKTRSNILKLTLALVDNLDKTNLDIVLNSFEKHGSNFDEISRGIMFDILIKIFNNVRKITNISIEDTLATCRRIVLLNLDENDDKDKLLRLWLNNENSNVLSIFGHLLESLYLPNVEDKYFGYFCYLFLDAVRSADSKNIFVENPVRESDNEELDISKSYKHQYSRNRMFGSSSMATVAGKLRTSTILNTFTSRFSPMQIEATQTPASSIKTFLLNTETNETNDNETKYRDRNKPQFGSTKRFMAFRQVQSQVRNETERKETLKERELGIKIYRKYRKGDLPDVKIKLDTVINLLQAVAFHDSQFASVLFVNLFDNVIGSNDSQTSSTSANDVFRQINYNLSTSTFFVPSFIETFLTVVLKHKNKFSVKLHNDVISRVTLNSGLFSIGSLLIEEYIMDDDTDYIAPTKRIRLENNSGNYWIRLAELYRAMNEWDVVTSVFSKKIQCLEEAVLAIDEEASGLWSQASEHYYQSLQKDDSEERKEFYFHSYFKCLAYLSEWEQLSNKIEQSHYEDDASTLNVLVNDSESNKQTLKWFVTAEVRNSVVDGQKKQKLLTDINNILRNKALSDSFKQLFAEEIAFLFLTETDADLAKIYINRHLENFISEWSHINPLLVSQRSSKLLSVQSLMDIEIFLSNGALTAKTSHWLRTSLDDVNDILAIEKRYFYRHEMLSSLNANQDITLLQMLLDKNLIKTAIKTSNFHIAKEARKNLKHKMNTLQITDDLNVPYLDNEIILLAFKLSDNEELKHKTQCLKKFLKNYDLLNVPEVKNDLGLMMNVNDQVFEMTQSISKLGPSILSAMTYDEIVGIKQSFKMLESAEITLDFIETYGVSTLKNSLDYCNNELKNLMDGDHKDIYDSLGKSYYKIASYSKTKCQNREFIEYTLSSMLFGSFEGRQLFPCILNAPDLHQHVDLFVEKVKNISTWMFLKWIPQLLANLLTNKISAVKDIVMRIAETYPQAIMYSYRLSKDKYNVAVMDKEIQNDGVALIKKLDEILLANPSINLLLKSLTSVSLPFTMLEHNLNKLKDSTTNNNFDETLLEVIEDLFSEAVLENGTRGVVWFRVLEFKKDFEALKTANKNEIDAKLKKIYRKYQRCASNAAENQTTLVSYSPWLANCHDLADIEIPGQYSGDMKPLVHYHAKIFSFSPYVEVFRSKTNPIRITINSHDGKEYDFLVKYGEDLRQDQRIEQLFNNMNNIFKNDIDCEKRQLSIVTYQVIPLTNRLGMIEFMKNTKKLKKLIYDNVDEQCLKNAHQEYDSWLRKCLMRGDNDLKMYTSAAVKYDARSTEEKMAELIKYIPSDTFRKAFWSISIDVASFVALRRRFVISYSVQCVANWILGIGDRHLDNTLLCMDNGVAIPIDFGYAFGTSTQFQLVPELVPFRLTPQFLNLMQPLNETGYFDKTMIYALSALRKNCYILLATMEVFIQEPSLDWLIRVQQQPENAENKWYPSMKIKQANDKLNGATSVAIMIEDLLHRTCDAPEVNRKYVEHVQRNLREEKSKSFLSCSEQVQCLIAHATDRNLLGRIYAGWEPWI